MELLEGRTLAGLLASRGRLEMGNVVHVGRQLTFALAHVHGFGLIHRDIKPSNILIARTELGQEALKLIDFGIVRACDAEDGARRLTEDGAILGTPEYMAPEQLLGQDVDSRCDVYGAGVSLYECLTGVVPFEGTLGEILLKACTQQAPPIAGYRPEIPHALASVIEKAIARRPDHRFATAREFYDEITALAVQRWPRRPLLGLEDGQQAAGREQENPAESSPVGQQRRRHARAPYLTPVRTTQLNGTHQDGRSEDISEAGLLVVLPQGLEHEERVRIRFALPVSGRIVTTTARACWLRPSRTGVAVGLALALDDEDRATIGYYVSKMRQN
jgi:serine/threonine protein kinase